MRLVYPTQLKNWRVIALEGLPGLFEKQDSASELPLTQQADLLSVSRSSLYYQPREPSAEEIAIKHRIDELYTASIL